MIRKHLFQTFGDTETENRKSKHHFSFENYFTRFSFGDLLFVNDDIIAPNTHLKTRTYQNIELITIVRYGTITCDNSNNNTQTLNTNDFQILDTGEKTSQTISNNTDDCSQIYQIGIKSGGSKQKTNQNQQQITYTNLDNQQDDTDNKIHIIGQNKNWKIYCAKLQQGKLVKYQPCGQAYILVSDGDIKVSWLNAQKGDAFEIRNEDNVSIKANDNSIFFIIEVEKDGLV